MNAIKGYKTKVMYFHLQRSRRISLSRKSRELELLQFVANGECEPFSPKQLSMIFENVYCWTPSARHEHNPLWRQQYFTYPHDERMCMCVYSIYIITVLS